MKFRKLNKRTSLTFIKIGFTIYTRFNGHVYYFNYEGFWQKTEAYWKDIVNFQHGSLSFFYKKVCMNNEEMQKDYKDAFEKFLELKKSYEGTAS